MIITPITASKYEAKYQLNIVRSLIFHLYQSNLFISVSDPYYWHCISSNLLPCLIFWIFIIYNDERESSPLIMPKDHIAIIYFHRYKGHRSKQTITIGGQSRNNQDHNKSSHWWIQLNKSMTFDMKIELMRMLSGIFRKNNFNSLILAKRDREIMEFNYSILGSIISFLFTIKEVRNVEEMVEFVVPFVQAYPINGKIIKSILSVVTKDFYY